jgi:hypothetical protein
LHIFVLKIVSLSLYSRLAQEVSIVLCAYNVCVSMSLVYCYLYSYKKGEGQREMNVLFSVKWISEYIRLESYFANECSNLFDFLILGWTNTRIYVIISTQGKLGLHAKCQNPGTTTFGRKVTRREKVPLIEVTTLCL